MTSNKISNLNRLQVEIVGQLSGQMADMVVGVVETVGEEPEPESEGIPEQHEVEEEELTKVNYLYNSVLQLFTFFLKTMSSFKSFSPSLTGFGACCFVA